MPAEERREIALKIREARRPKPINQAEEAFLQPNSAVLELLQGEGDLEELAVWRWRLALLGSLTLDPTSQWEGGPFGGDVGYVERRGTVWDMLDVAGLQTRFLELLQEALDVLAQEFPEDEPLLPLENVVLKVLLAAEPQASGHPGVLRSGGILDRLAKLSPPIYKGDDEVRRVCRSLMDRGLVRHKRGVGYWAVRGPASP